MADSAPPRKRSLAETSAAGRIPLGCSGRARAQNSALVRFGSGRTAVGLLGPAAAPAARAGQRRGRRGSGRSRPGCRPPAAYSTASAASVRVIVVLSALFATGAVAATPKAQTHQPCRRRARMWQPQTRAGMPSSASIGPREGAEVGPGPADAVEEPLDQAGGAVAAQQLGVRQGEREQQAADQDGEDAAACRARAGRRRAGRRSASAPTSDRARVVYSKRASEIDRLEADGRDRADGGDQDRDHRLAGRLHAAHRGHGRHHGEHGAHDARHHRGAGGQQVVGRAAITATPRTSATPPKTTGRPPVRAASAQVYAAGDRDRAGTARAASGRPSARPWPPRSRPARRARRAPRATTGSPRVPQSRRDRSAACRLRATASARSTSAGSGRGHDRKVTDGGSPATGWSAGPSSRTLALEHGGDHLVAVAGLGEHVAERVDDHRVAGVARGRAAPRRRRTPCSRSRGPGPASASGRPSAAPATQAAGTTSTSAPASTRRAGELGEPQVVAGHQADREAADLGEHRLELARADSRSDSR